MHTVCYISVDLFKHCKCQKSKIHRLLTNEQVRYCREVYKPIDKEFGAKALAKKFNVNIDVVYDAVSGRTYKNVK